jgi:sporulation protein YlmC with PRC-barrel domain
MEKMKHRRLQELDDSGFEMVKGEPDIRGWDVRNNPGQKLGEVEELIIDIEQKKVRYMVVDLDSNELKLKLAHRKVLLPIGLAELHKEDDDVILPNVTAEHLSALPAYDKNNLSPETERMICTTLGRKRETTTVLEGEALSPEFYRHEYYNDDNLYKHRLHELEQKKKQDNDYEKGLRLWEMRSEGGVLPDNNREQPESRKEINEDARMEMVRNRRQVYENNRNTQPNNDTDSDRSHRKHNSIITRTRDEGLQDG